MCQRKNSAITDTIKIPKPTRFIKTNGLPDKISDFQDVGIYGNHKLNIFLGGVKLLPSSILSLIPIENATERSGYGCIRMACFGYGKRMVYTRSLKADYYMFKP